MQNRPRSRTQNKTSMFGRRRSFSAAGGYKQGSSIRHSNTGPDPLTHSQEKRNVKEEYVIFNPSTSMLSLTEKKSIHQRQSTINGRPNVLLLQEMEKIQN